MNSVLSGYVDKFVQLYLDDFHLYSKTAQEHLEHIKLVLNEFRQHKLYVNPSTGPKRGSVTWSSQCQIEFENLKAMLTNAPVLRPPDIMSKPFIIETDISDSGCGGVLLQRDEQNVLHPLAFESKKFSTAERRYPAQERELLR
ncbi:hypothetical protein [Parasitella parasitica]|uniref:Reverse transcriptase/retrotransposon-derived protein RNase H-like domain-containing protein n=1 Tax=Parasitella parasitica TaxID=35722 RepID=A0A0B7N051_9FUNG|nr:hypothetical protein [Parasitella parasitica]